MISVQCCNVHSGCVLFTVAKHAKQSGAYKLARHALDKIKVRTNQLQFYSVLFKTSFSSTLVAESSSKF